jgi:hypothetical protein
MDGEKVLISNNFMFKNDGQNNVKNNDDRQSKFFQKKYQPSKQGQKSEVEHITLPVKSFDLHAKHRNLTD